MLKETTAVFLSLLHMYPMDTHATEPTWQSVHPATAQLVREVEREWKHFPHTDPALIKKVCSDLTLSEEESDAKFAPTMVPESRAIFQEITQKLGTSKIPIIGYGSLINPKSAARTLSEEVIQQSNGVHVYSYQRTFNTFWPYYDPRAQEDDATNEIAFLNIQKAKNEDHFFNAMLFWIDENDFIKLRSRELTYDLVPVAVALLDANHHPIEDKPMVAYAWMVTDPDYLCQESDLPRPAYFPIMEEALKEQKTLEKLGPTALEDYYRSTFLANGQPIKELSSHYQAPPIY